MMTENKSIPLFAPLGKTEDEILQNFDIILQSVKPLSSKQLYMLPKMVNELSHLLTDERSKRRNGYMNENATLSAYTHYFMWWNLYRLTHLFAGMPPDSFQNLTDGDYCLDLGSGPLTVVCALWLSRPELRLKKLIWYCLDSSNNALSLGEEIFLSICAKTNSKSNAKSDSTSSSEPQNEIWKIIKIKGDLTSKINNKASLITCANMFNELYYDTKMSLEEAAKKYTASTLSYATNDSSILIVEPAFPRSSRFISLTRDALIRKKFHIISPCPHETKCPMDGKKGGKWCHFVLETENATKGLAAPKKLMQLSQKCSLPKDRASVSFVFATSNSNMQVKPSLKSSKSLENSVKIRIASDEIVLPARKFGRYACSEKGLVLAKNLPKSVNSGDILEFQTKKSAKSQKSAQSASAQSASAQIDKKTGAEILDFGSQL